MSYVVTSKCINCKYSDCVMVCPVNCFYEGPNMLVINPDECIDCGLCLPECPIEAISADADVAVEEKRIVEMNRELSLIWPNILEKKEPLQDAEYWKGKENKLEYLKI